MHFIVSILTLWTLGGMWMFSMMGGNHIEMDIRNMSRVKMIQMTIMCGPLFWVFAGVVYGSRRIAVYLDNILP